MSLKIVQMRFRGPARFGARGFQLEGAEEFVRSDTLFSALCHAWHHLYDEALTDLFVGKDAPFLLSSALPYQQTDGNITYCLPKPMMRPNIVPDDPVGRKKLKDVSFLPLDAFRRWIAGDPVEVESIPEELPMPEKHFVPRVSISRDTSNSEVYRAARVVFREDAGLYALIQFGDSALEDRIEAAFKLLGDMGLGGERSIGHGQFHAEMVDAGTEWAFLAERPDAGQWVTLSLVNPRADEVDAVRNGSYQLVDRGGWFHSPVSGKQLKRKTMCMVSEGSALARKANGQIVDVTPSVLDNTDHHRIYRYGLCFAAPATPVEGR